MNGETDHANGIRRSAVSRNIDCIVELEKEDERKLSRFHRASHTVGWFVGTIHFVILQLLLVVAWVVWNAYGAARFDPYPFNLLSAVLALEAVLLTSFVLIRQNTMDQRSERRNHLDLQINLLAEKEATSILHKLDAIAAKFGVEFPQDFEATELAKDTQVESIARDLRVRNDKTSA
jgi:uncharacterized membrane protein